jgi:hypothetical protein
MATVRRSVWTDVRTLASNLRVADRAEVKALGSYPFLALAQGFALSEPPLSIVTDQDEPIGMFGVVPLENRAGSIWLLGSDTLVTEAKTEFLRCCRGWVDHFQQDYELLTNVCDPRNSVHIRWLGWCGFRFTEEHIINDHTFIQFERRAHV